VLGVLLARGRSWTARALAIGPMLAVLPLLAPSLVFQLRHAFFDPAPATWRQGWSVSHAGGALAGAILAQALLWSPWVLGRGLRVLGQRPVVDRAAVGMMTGLVMASALARAIPPEPNWWAPGALILILSAACSPHALTARARAAMLAMVLVPTAVAAAHTVRPFLPLPTEMDPTARLHGWSKGTEPARAPGVGPYGPLAERCVYRGECSEIVMYFNEMNICSSSSVTDEILR
jgi:hypothetical protein